jgi:hypothetical protein
LKSTGNACFVCGGTSFRDSTRHYVRCVACGHEVLGAPRPHGNLVNDRLDRAGNVGTPTALDRFRNAVLRKVTRERRLLVDVGSASGRFLFQNRRHFSRTIGIEVTPECVEFSRKLGLTVETELPALREEVSVATFWHSLEHIPPVRIAETLDIISERSSDDAVVIVSVPNADSLQYRLLKDRFAYYDVPHHLHQFTGESLDRLFDRFGFERIREFGSFSYAGFGWLQGMLNLFNARHDYLYYRKKRGWDYGLPPLSRWLLDGYNLVLAAGFLFPCLLLTLHDLACRDRGGVLTVCYRKKNRSK